LSAKLGAEHTPAESGGMIMEIEELKGKVLTAILVESDPDDAILFTTRGGVTYKMYHEQDCCEDVHIEDMCGEWDDLLGHPLLIAEEATNKKETEYERETWTFYKLATVKGYVTIRWHGTSNGYYSESVSIIKCAS